MKQPLMCVTLICIALLATGCTPTCKGDSCSRPQSTSKNLVIWWPAHMRVEPGPAAERADYQTVSLER